MSKRWNWLGTWTVVLVVAGLLGAASGAARAQGMAGASLPSGVSASLQDAANSGPRALLDRLDKVLAANRGLAANAGSAAALARAATLPIRQFRGANVPVYREVAAKIIAAAPAQARAEVSRAVAEEVRQVAARDPMVREPLAGDVEALTRQARREATQTTSARGFNLDSFTIYPELQVSEFYDNNIFATKTNERNDFVTVISPVIYAGSNWSRHSLNFQAHADLTRYHEHDSENSNDYWASSEGRFDLSDSSNLFGGVLAGQWHEDRESPNQLIGGLEPTIYHEVRGYGGVEHKIGATTIRVGGTWGRLLFDDTPTTAGLFPNGDRDRDHVTGGARVSYRLDSTFQPYVDASYDRRDYRLARDNFGFDRDSHGYWAFVGTNVTVTGKVAGEIYGGYLGQNYDDPRLEDVAVPGFGGNVRWAVTTNLLFSAWADRSIQETTIFGASSYVYTGTGTTLDYDLTKAIVLTLRGVYGQSRFEGAGRIDDDYDTGFSVRYNFTDRLFVATDYRFQRRISSSSAFDYARHQVFLRAGANF